MCLPPVTRGEKSRDWKQRERRRGRRPGGREAGREGPCPSSTRSGTPPVIGLPKNKASNTSWLREQKQESHLAPERCHTLCTPVRE